jgi:hypothetical protein
MPGREKRPPAFSRKNTTIRLTLQDYSKIGIIPIKLIRCYSGGLWVIPGLKNIFWNADQGTRPPVLLFFFME